MADRDITLRLAVTNAERAIRDLKSFGGDGEKALKRIEDSSGDASKDLAAFRFVPPYQGASTETSISRTSPTVTSHFISYVVR